MLKGDEAMKITAEILLFSAVTMNAALLTFIAGVLGRVMDDMDVVKFKAFVNSLVFYSKRSPFMLTLLNAPFAGAIVFIYFYGLGDRWIITGLAIWCFAGSVAKIIKVPVYKRIAALDERDVDRLQTERKRLNNGNVFQAALNSIAASVMLLTFLR